MAINRSLPALTACIAVSASMLAATSHALAQSAKGSVPPAQPAVAAPPAAMSMLDPVGSFAPMLARVIPSVVTVLVSGETVQTVEIKPRAAGDTGMSLPPPRKEPFRSGGSGIIVDPGRGHILTNNHVIADAVAIEVSLSDGRRMPARLVGRDIGTDVAVIEVDERNLPGIPIGNSDNVRVGDVVLAVGNPFGLEGTATLGIVSATMRTAVGHETFEDFMQIDAAINPGNSGGALVNVRGELVGVNTAGPGDTSKASGIGFVIPINLARAIKGEIIAHGRMRRGSPGLIVEDLSRETITRLKSTVTRGAHVIGIVPGSSAEKAQLRPGYIVTAIDGKPVRNGVEFDTRVATVPAGSTLRLEVQSDGRRQEIALVASEIILPPAVTRLSREFGSLSEASIGDIRQGNPHYGELRGAQILDIPKVPSGAAIGLEVGDVIVSIDNAPVRSPADLERMVERAAMQYRLGIVRDGRPAWLRASR